MPLHISIDVSGEAQVSRKLMRVSQAADDMRPAFEKIAEYLRGVERTQFDSAGRTGSGGWAPLKPATIARKRAKGQDTRILRATKALQQSLTNKTSGGHVERFSRDEMFFGTVDKKAKFHQHGTRRMPQRKVIDLSERDRRRIVKDLQQHIIEQMR